MQHHRSVSFSLFLDHAIIAVQYTV